MNYDQKNIAEASKADREGKEFPILYEYLNRNNDQMSKLLSELESKLHALKDKRVPEKDPIANAEKPATDFIGALEFQLKCFDRNNDRLLKIVNHLDQLI